DQSARPATRGRRVPRRASERRRLQACARATLCRLRSSATIAHGGVPFVPPFLRRARVPVGMGARGLPRPVSTDALVARSTQNLALSLVQDTQKPLDIVPQYGSGREFEG